MLTIFGAASYVCDTEERSKGTDGRFVLVGGDSCMTECLKMWQEGGGRVKALRGAALVHRAHLSPSMLDKMRVPPPAGLPRVPTKIVTVLRFGTKLIVHRATQGHLQRRWTAFFLLSNCFARFYGSCGFLGRTIQRG